MPEGPTTEGSIVAYLRLNDSDWNEKLDAAEARARELGRTDPNIKVNADVAEAMAKIEALRSAENSLGGVNVRGSGSGQIDEVTAAQKRYEAAMQSARIADQQAEIAEMRLNDVRDKRGRTDAQVAAAELALERATVRANSADDKAIAAQRALNAAKEQQADATDRSAMAALREAAAVDADRNAKDKANQSNQQNLGYMGMIVAAIGASIPMMSQLAGATIGLAGGMAGLGAAGVLAILGIKNEMAQGTAAGNEYAAGIQQLQGNLRELESTASNGVLDGFDRSLSALNAGMPALNSEIRLFSSELGTAGGILTTGIITALRIMNPLFIQAGFYVEQLAAGFTTWTHDGGLRQFTQDAIVALPQVTNAIGDLLHGVLSLIQAFSPLGPVLLGVLSLLGNLMSLLAMLGPALPPIVAGAVAAFLMFMKWQAISPILEDVAWRLGAVGLAADIASGPVGWIIGAASLLAVGLVGIATAAGQATQATQDYTAAVQQDNGVMGQSVEKQAADNLQKTGALDLAKKLKISTQDLTAATTTDDAARQKLIATLKEQIQAGTIVHATGKAVVTTYTDQAKAAQQLLPILQNTHDSITNSIKAYNDVAKAQGQATISTRDQLNAAQQLASSYGMSVPQMLAAEAAQKQNADQAAATTQQLQFENDAATLLTNAFTLLNGGMLSVAQAQTGAAAAGNTLLDSLKQNGVAIDGNSKAAVANQQALEQKVQADQQAAEAIAKQTGSTQAGTAAFAASKQALIDQLKAAGNLTPAIQALIDKYYAVPPVVKTRAELDADAAKAKADALAASLSQIARDWTAQVNIVTTGSMPTAGHLAAQASGGPAGAQYLATGGFGWRSRGTDTIPAVLSPGEFVVKEKSASYDPQFMKAYNDDPARALAAKQGQGAGSSDRPIYADGIGLIGWVRELAGQQARLHFNAALASSAMQISGGSTV